MTRAIRHRHNGGGREGSCGSYVSAVSQRQWPGVAVERGKWEYLVRKRERDRELEGKNMRA